MAKNFFEKLMKAKRARKARKIFERGLEARDVTSAKILGENCPCLLLLCSTPRDEVYALAGAQKPLLLLGKRLKLVPEGEARVLDSPSDWVALDGSLEGLRAPLIVARGVVAC